MTAGVLEKTFGDDFWDNVKGTAVCFADTLKTRGDLGVYEGNNQ